MKGPVYFCFSFKFRRTKKLQMWAARHTYTKMLDWKKKRKKKKENKKVSSADKERMRAAAPLALPDKQEMSFYLLRDRSPVLVFLSGYWTQQTAWAGTKVFVSSVDSKAGSCEPFELKCFHLRLLSKVTTPPKWKLMSLDLMTTSVTRTDMLFPDVPTCWARSGHH